MPIVHTQQLTKIYRSGFVKRKEVAALKDVSISIERGEIFGLLGPNGAGKTTFVKILLSIVFPTKGQAEIFGQKLGTLEIREKSGYLPENHRYPGFLTGLQTLHLFGQLHGLNGSVLNDRAKSLLELVGLKDWGKVKIKRYSKGMLQRLGIAQALMNDPEILFLDEPTDGVDPVGRKEIRDLLKDLRAKGTTIFLNSHMLSEVEAISDRVAILNKGEVLKVGTVADITSTKLEYEIQLDQVASEQLCAKIRPFVRELKSNEKTLIVAVYDKNDIHKVQDLIRQEGVFIESMSPKKSSLEDYFIQLIQSGESK